MSDASAHDHPEGPDTRRLLLFTIGTAGAFFVLAVASMALFLQGNVTAVWPANAVLIGALFLSRLRAWPFLTVGAAVASLAASSLTGADWHVGLASTFASCAASLVGALLLRQRYAPDAEVSENGFLWWLFACTAVASPVVSATIGLALVGPQAGGSTWLWLTWACAESLGNLILLPFMLATAEAIRRGKLKEASGKDYFEGASILLLVAGVSVAVFFGPQLPDSFLIFPAIVLAASRLGASGAGAAVVIVGLIGVWPSANGQGPLGLADLPETGRVLLFQLLLVSLRLTAFPVAVVLTAANRASVQLAESEAQHRSILQGVSDVIFRIDAEGRWTYLNSAWQRMSGFPLDKTLGRPFLDFVREEDRAAALEMFKPLATGKLAECRNEICYLCTDGEYRWAEVSARAIRTASGQFAGSYGTIVDITERKLADSQMRSEEQRYRAIFDTAVDAIVVIDNQGSIHSFNPAAEQIFGYEAGEVIGLDVGMLMAPSEAEAHARHLQRYMAGGPSRIIGVGRELVGRRKDGTLFPLELSIAEWERDGTRFFTGHMRDISVRRAAEDRLRAATERTEASNRLLTMAEALAHVGHWRMDLVTRKRFWSDEVYRIHGREPGGPLPYATTEELWHPEDREHVLQAYNRFASEGGSLSFTARIVHEDGSIRHVAVDGQAELDAGGTVVAAFGVMQDITARVDAEEAMRESERRYRLVAENVTDVIVQLDLDDRCTYASRSMLEVTGFTAEEAIGVDLLGITHPEDRDRIREDNDRLKRGEVDQIVIEYRTRNRNGDWIWLEARSRLVRGADEVPEGVVSVVRDVSQRKALEAELIAAKDQAVANGSAKSDFLATMSHELRTPMTGVLGMLELLRLDPTAEERQRYLDTLESSAKTMMQVVDDILDFSKIEAGKLAIEEVDFDVDRLARETVDLFRTPASTRGVVLNLRVATEGAGPIVRGDPTRIRQVLSNLVGNALKFTDRGAVDIEIAPQGAVWAFAVRDTGIGIAPDVLPHLFQAFSQADNSTTRRFGGTGLGLAICKRLVAAMNGKIGVESQPGQGSRFWFELPLQPGDAEKLTAADHRQAYEASARSLNILLAEDNSVNQLLVTSMLRKMGHEVTCVGNGQLAVEAVKSGRFDLVFMDMQMPVMDGPTATSMIRSLGERGTIPIYALTADALMQRRDVYAEIGLDGFLAKPINAAAIRAVLDSIAGRSDGVREAGTAEAAEGNDTAFFDLERLAALKDEFGAELVADLLRLLVEDVRSKLATLPAVVDASNRPEVGRIAHAIKGAAGNVAAARLEAAAKRVEMAGRAEEEGPCDLAELREVAQGTLVAAERLCAEAA